MKRELAEVVLFAIILTGAVSCSLIVMFDLGLPVIAASIIALFEILVPSWFFSQWIAKQRESKDERA